MRIGFRASHLLHYRPLIATACEMVSRGHEVFVQCSSNSSVMRCLHRRYTPTKMRWVDQKSLHWLAEYINYGSRWEVACQNIGFCKELPRDCLTVSTIKDIHTLKKGDVALGYQHLPVTIKVGEEVDTVGVDNFFTGSDFSLYHKFHEIMAYGTAYGTKFSHLIHIESSSNQYSKYVMILHPGANRGTDGDEWLRETIEIIRKAKLEPIIKIHPVPGIGYTKSDLSLIFPDVMISDKWWYPLSEMTCCTLTVGSSALYEFWSTGYNTIYVLNYINGRKNHFKELNSCLISSKDMLYSFLVERGYCNTDRIDDIAFQYYDNPSVYFQGILET